MWTTCCCVYTRVSSWDLNVLFKVINVKTDCMTQISLRTYDFTEEPKTTLLFPEAIQCDLHFRRQKVFTAPSVSFVVETGSKWLFGCLKPTPGLVKGCWGNCLLIVLFSCIFTPRDFKSSWYQQQMGDMQAGHWEPWVYIAGAPSIRLLARTASMYVLLYSSVVIFHLPAPPITFLPDPEEEEHKVNPKI